MRSALTMLGVIIGIAAVIAMVTIGRGAQLQTENQLKSLGSNLIFVQSGDPRRSPASQGSGSATTLVWDDARAIAAAIPAVAQVAPMLSARGQVVLAERNTNISIVGTTPYFVGVRDFLPLTGRFFNEAELEAERPGGRTGPNGGGQPGKHAAGGLDQQIRIRGELHGDRHPRIQGHQLLPRSG